MNAEEREGAASVADELGAELLPPARVPAALHEAMVAGVLDPGIWHVPHVVMETAARLPSGTLSRDDPGEIAAVFILRVHALGDSDEPAATAVVACHGEWRLPDMVAAPEGVLDRLGQLFGGDDVDFDTDRDFSNAFKVSGGSEQRVRALLRPEVRRRLLQLHPVEAEVRRRSVLLLRREALPLGDVPDFVAQAVGVVRELVE